MKLAGAEGWVPSDKDLSNAKLKGADASGCHVWAFDLRGPDFSESNLQKVNLTNAKMQDARLPAWSSGRLEGVKLAEAEVWVPTDKDLSNVKLQSAVLKGAGLSKCDLSGADLSSADLREANVEGMNLRDTTLCAVILHAAKAPATLLDLM